MAYLIMILIKLAEKKIHDFLYYPIFFNASVSLISTPFPTYLGLGLLRIYFIYTDHPDDIGDQRSVWSAITVKVPLF